MFLDPYGRILTAPAGSVDDGTSEGAVRQMLTTGELIKLPFPDGSIQYETNGTGYSYIESGGPYAPGNSDHSGTSLIVQATDVPSTSGGNRLSFPFYGTRFGLRWMAVPSAQRAIGFSVDIDGMTYDIRQKVDGMLQAGTGFYSEQMWMCPDHLKDHRHTARIYVPGSMVSGQTWYSYLNGIVVERRPGNGDPIPPGRLVRLDTGYLTQNFAAVKPYLSNNLAQYARAIRRIDYYNTDSAHGHTIYLKLNSIAYTFVEIGLGAASSGANSPATSPAPCASWPAAAGSHDTVMNIGNDTTAPYATDFEHRGETGIASNVIGYTVWGVV